MANDINKVERILRKGLYSLSDSLYQYWPVGSSQNEIPEVNISIHVAGALINAGYCVYGEYRSSEGVDTVAHDLYAFLPSTNEQIVMEFKRFPKTDAEASVSTDIQRIKSNWAGRKALGAVVFLTQSSNFMQWWLSDEREPSSMGTAREWQLLDKHLKGISKKVLGHVAMPHSGDVLEDGSIFFQEALYLLFEI